MENEDLVPVAVFTLPDEARMARSMLDSAGIPAFIEHEHIGTIYGGVIQAIDGGLPLLVPASRLDEAREVLNTPVPEESLNEQAEAAEKREE
ncbi:MAG: DUF2007 domain-containing protein [Bryobacteraceae bacterium]